MRPAKLYESRRQAVVSAGKEEGLLPPRRLEGSGLGGGTSPKHQCNANSEALHSAWKASPPTNPRREQHGWRVCGWLAGEGAEQIG